MTAIRMTAVTAIFLFLFACAKSDVVPQMQEVLQAFGKADQLAVLINKYGNPGIVPPELYACTMTKPNITKIEKSGDRLVYTMESRVDKCEASPTAVGTVRIFSMGWENGRIVSFAWGGPKGGKVEY